MSAVKSRQFYEKNWRRIEPFEQARHGDVWFPGGFAGREKPRFLVSGIDCMDPIGFQDDAIFREPGRVQHSDCRDDAAHRDAMEDAFGPHGQG